MPVLHHDLAGLAAALSADGRGNILLDGVFLGPDPEAIDAVIAFRDRLYYSWYCRPQDPAAFANAVFPMDLAAAHPGADRWDRDWIVRESLDSGRLLVVKDDRRRWVPPGAYLFRNPGYSPAEGAKVDLFAPRDAAGLQPGYYYAFGRTLEDDAARQDGVRLYLAIAPDEAPLVLSRLVTVLNAYEVPFRYKCLSDPSSYGRADSAVLYVARRFAQTACLLLPEIWRGADRQSPAMTRVVLPGIGMAEDPPGGESFGLHRCQILAAALLGATGEWEKAIQTGFQTMGLEAARPWLNPGSSDLALAASLEEKRV